MEHVGIANCVIDVWKHVAAQFKCLKADLASLASPNIGLITRPRRKIWKTLLAHRDRCRWSACRPGPRVKMYRRTEWESPWAAQAVRCYFACAGKAAHTAQTSPLSPQIRGVGQVCSRRKAFSEPQYICTCKRCVTDSSSAANGDEWERVCAQKSVGLRQLLRAEWLGACRHTTSIISCSWSPPPIGSQKRWMVWIVACLA